MPVAGPLLRAELDRPIAAQGFSPWLAQEIPDGDYDDEEDDGDEGDDEEDDGDEDEEQETWWVACHESANPPASLDFR